MSPEHPPIAGLSLIAPGVQHTCALESGAVVCWGLNRFDILGVGPGLGDSVTTPAPVVGLEQAGPIVQVATDYDFSCALAESGAVYCWGDNDRSQLGVGDAIRRDRPTPVGLAVVGVGLRATAIDLGYEQSCARDRETTWCWGDRLAPAVVATLAGVDAIANPGGYTCTLAGGEMRCWGRNSGGQIGNGEGGCEYDEPLCADCKRLPDRTCKHVDQPTEPLGLPKLAAIAAGGHYTYALDRAGGVWQWGQVGETMSISPKPNYQPQRVTELPPIVSLSAGNSHVCARSEAGEVFCWGNDSFGQLGFENTDRNASDHPTPRRVEGLPPASAIAAGFYFSCALTGTGPTTQAWCWGDNAHGQLGDGTTERRHAPTLVSSRG